VLYCFSLCGAFLTSWKNNYLNEAFRVSLTLGADFCPLIFLTEGIASAAFMTFQADVFPTQCMFYIIH
jgi:hypothetical protein